MMDRYTTISNSDLKKIEKGLLASGACIPITEEFQNSHIYQDWCEALCLVRNRMHEDAGIYNVLLNGRKRFSFYDREQALRYTPTRIGVWTIEYCQKGKQTKTARWNDKKSEWIEWRVHHEHI